jgi:class 3 adenylate cyclase
MSQTCKRQGALLFWLQRRVSVAGCARHGGVVLKEQGDDIVASFFQS